MIIFFQILMRARESNVARYVNEKEIYQEYVTMEYVAALAISAISTVVRSHILFGRDYYNDLS